MKLEEVAQVSAAVGATSGRLEKIAKLAALLARLSPDEIQIAIGFLIGWPRQGKLGVGWSAVSAARETTAAAAPTLDLRDVDAAFARLQTVRGKNSGSERARLLGELFARGTIDEQRFLGNLIVGEVRQGALEGVLLEAIAKAAGMPSHRVRRAAMMAGDLGTVARAGLGDDRGTALAAEQLQLFRAGQPMLGGLGAPVARG